MPSQVKKCRSCGTPLAASVQPGQLVCPSCGTRYAARATNRAAPTAPGVALEALSSPVPDVASPRPASTESAPSIAAAFPLRAALILGGVGAAAILLMAARVVVVVVLWPRGPQPIVQAPPAATPPVGPARKPPVAPPSEDEPGSTPPRKRPVPEDGPPELAPPADPAPNEAVGKAVARAVVYLKKQVDNNLQGETYAGNRTGIMALIGLALLESGVAADDPAVQKAVEEVRSKAAQLNNTYEISLCVWFLDRLGDAQDEERIRTLAAQLINGQAATGAWTYICNPMSAAQQKQLLEVLAKTDVSSPIPPGPGLPPVCQFYRGKNQGQISGFGDLSVTQFSVLALWVARKHKVPSDRSLLLTEASCRAIQAPEGSWSYVGNTQYMRDSMTCAGLMALAVGRGVDPVPTDKTTESANPAVDKALLFLNDVFDRGIPPPEPPPDADKAATLAAVTAALRTSFAVVLKRGVVTIAPEDLTAVEADVSRALTQDLPADSKKQLQQVLDLARQYGGNPVPGKKQELAMAMKEFLRKNVAFPTPFTAGKRFLKPRPPVDGTWDDVYFLWSMERMAMVYDFKTIAGHDWYAWGSDLLIGYQNEDGSWKNAYSGSVDTGLALLFLKRTNVAKDLTVKLQLVGIRDVSADKITRPPGDVKPPGLIKTPPDKP